jgi:hypothetical protein
VALKKSTLTQYGVTGEYWRLDNMRFSKQENVLYFSLLLYPNSQTAQMIDVFPLENKGFSFEPTSEEWSGDIRVACYNFAKQDSEFEGAEDC